MTNLNVIIANNLVYLRKKAGLTQSELGEKFSYTDKTVSRWENGSVTPSVETLKDIADFYGVSLDYLTSEHHSSKEFESVINKTINAKNKIIIIALNVTVLWLIAITIYVASIYNIGTTDMDINRWWTVFLWTIPLSFLYMALLTRRSFKGSKWILVFLSAFVWTILAASFVTFLYAGNYWYLFFIGVPVQVALILIGKLKN